MSFRLDATPVAALPAFDAAVLADTRSVTMDRALAPALLASGKAADNRERLLKGALCVTTGQQPGLFTGPLFTIYKALSAVALAQRFERDLDRPVVPVFWVAGDDHDLTEANHVHILTLSNTVERLATRERDAEQALRPLYREPLSDDVGRLLERLEAEAPDTEFRGGVFAWLRRHYRPEADFASAFADAVAELLGPHGVVVFRPTHQAAKRLMAPRLIEALAQGSELDRVLADTAARLERAPVAVGDGATLVMVEGELGRDRLVLEDGTFRSRRSGTAWTLDELRELAEDDPQRLSPNVLLRPVIEAALLPTLAYVAGPGELAYIPQCAPIYEALGVNPQVALPRWSGRIIESRIAKVLDKYRIAADDLARPEGQLEAELVRDAMPPAATEALTALRKVLDQEYDRLDQAATAIDPTLKKTIQHAKGSAFKELGHVEKRILRHLKKENEIVLQQLSKARGSLFPLGKPQERVFNVVPYLVRYGSSMFNRILDAAAQQYGSLEPGSVRG